MTEERFASVRPDLRCPLRHAFCLLLFITFCNAVISPVFAQRLISQSDSTELTLRQREIGKQRLRLASSDVEERRDAVMQLGWMQQAESSRVAATALGDAAPVVRATAATAVLSLPSEEAVAVLIPLLKDKKEFVRQQVAYALGETHSPAAVEGLVTALEGDKQASVRGAAAVALGKIADETASAHLARTIDPGFAVSELHNQKSRKKGETDRFVQRAAARSLGQLRSRSSVPALIVAMADKRMSDDVRREAAYSLGLIGDITAVPVLRDALAARDPFLARIAYDALLKLSPADATTHP